MAESVTAKTFGLMAEFDTAKEIYHAAEGVRDAGYTLWDTHTPFPVHGLDKAMGLRRSPVPWVVLILGLSGAAGGMLLQWWVHAVDYPWVVSGKPLFSWPAFIPVTFELGILLAATGAVLGILGFSRLPQYYHPLFNTERFHKFSDDKFFVSIEARDPRFDVDTTYQLLKDLGATHVEFVEK